MCILIETVTDYEVSCFSIVLVVVVEEYVCLDAVNIAKYVGVWLKCEINISMHFSLLNFFVLFS